jgi:hypothetical protein
MTCAFGSEEHHALVKTAIRASLDQNPEVKAAFIATHPRPFVHALGRPGRAGTKFARILTEIREELIADHAAQNTQGSREIESVKGVH